MKTKFKDPISPLYLVLIGIGAFIVALLDYTVINDKRLGVLGSIGCGIMAVILVYFVVSRFAVMIIQMFRKQS